MIMDGLSMIVVPFNSDMISLDGGSEDTFQRTKHSKYTYLANSMNVQK